VYWVCPLIEESEELDLANAVETHRRLGSELDGLTVGLIHGRLPRDEKSTVMEAFSRNAIRVLVATTVIEVGVDVPNATLMVIEHAERLGLAQLHQLRGRVGRGGERSHCILLFANPLSELARARLKVMFETSDGFEIARRDLELRGPGEIIGARQSGAPMLRYADIVRDADLVETARDIATRLLDADPASARRVVARWIPDADRFGAV
jgi:ATP-dependent DNA helicase RecG